ncbi:hypothetical protein BJY01DRAFT_245342 [Aspergillus pseudoustus]|uniref:Uncharacterized protein n=1 Tax=Aspergillus pseudoustus TaxID=1810923 RepID=A0ABR4KED9_9EURO
MDHSTPDSLPLEPNKLTSPIHHLECWKLLKTRSAAKMPTPSQRRTLAKDQDVATTGAASEKPSFNGPGGASASTTSSQNPKPHSSRLLNKLDPRYNSDILEAQQKGKIGGSEERPGVEK